MFYQSSPDIADTPPSIWQESDKRAAEKLRKNRFMNIFPWYPNFSFIAMYWLVLPCNGFSFAKTVVVALPSLLQVLKGFRLNHESEMIENNMQTTDMSYLYLLV